MSSLPTEFQSEAAAIHDVDSERATTRRDESFYFVDIIFLVEGCLFKVPRTYFERDSEAFSAMFKLPVAQDVPVEGSSDQQPIHLEGITAHEFRQLLRVMYPQHVGQPDIMTYAEWKSVLKLSTMWNFEVLRDLAIQSMSELSINAVEKAALAREYDINEWLLPALNELAQREDPINIDEARRLGLEQAVMIAAVRESCIAWNEKGRFGRRGARTQIDFTGRIRATMDLP